MSRRLGLAAALAVVALANGWALAGAAWNRRGEPEALVAVSERELDVLAGPADDEDTGLALRLNWRPREFDDEGTGWLGPKKLAELGFDVHLTADHPGAERFYGRALPREAFVVLELGGESWSRWLAKENRELARLRREVAGGRRGREELERAERQLRWQLRHGPRLFQADVGASAAALRRRYPVRSRYLVLAGVVELTLWQPPGKPPALRGRVSRLAGERIHVPLRLRPPLGKYLRDYQPWHGYEGYDPDVDVDDDPPPPLRATIAVGRRHEPWLLDVRR